MDAKGDARQLSNFTYEDAVYYLQNLQHSASALKEITENNKNQIIKKKRISRSRLMRPFLHRSGLTEEEIDRLSVIHVSGTKGKGSTCAYCESILRSHGYKTGLFTSPHIDELRERIRVNGKPLSREKFAEYVQKLYRRINANKTKEGLSVLGGMPTLGQFYIIMAFHVFLDEKVDVAVIEVGIGGEFDDTNLFKHPGACGIVSLGMDHVRALGGTIQNIAWHKAGIFKKGCPALTVWQENPREVLSPDNLIRSKFLTKDWSAIQILKTTLEYLRWAFFRLVPVLAPTVEKAISPMEVILDRARTIKCPLEIASPLTQETQVKYNLKLGIGGKMQVHNAALAVGLCQAWKRSREKGYGKFEATKAGSIQDIARLNHEELDDATVKGLRTCHWPGRAHILKKERVTYYLDGAHTEDSMDVCVDWFKENADQEASSTRGSVLRILVYSVTGERNPEIQFRPLLGCAFDAVVFSTTLLSTVKTGNKADHIQKRISLPSMYINALENKKIWDSLVLQLTPNYADTFIRQKPIFGTSYLARSPLSSVLTSSSSVLPSTAPLSQPKVPSKATIRPPQISFVTPCILEALAWAGQGRDKCVVVHDPSAIFPEIPTHFQSAKLIQILITGSLHLVGPSLGVLDQSFNL